MKVQFNHQNGFFLDGRVFCEVYGTAENESDDELLNLGWREPEIGEENTLNLRVKMYLLFHVVDAIRKFH